MKIIQKIHSPESLYDTLFSTKSSGLFLLALRDLELYLKERDKIGYNEVEKLKQLITSIGHYTCSTSDYLKKLELCQAASSIYALAASKSNDEVFSHDAVLLSKMWKGQVDFYNRRVRVETEGVYNPERVDEVNRLFGNILELPKIVNKMEKLTKSLIDELN